MSASLVGSEMCIRDRNTLAQGRDARALPVVPRRRPPASEAFRRWGSGGCLLYTSDAADDM
eukprot:6715604-Alexandrium_andersonii.AAC.1